MEEAKDNPAEAAEAVPIHRWHAFISILAFFCGAGSFFLHDLVASSFFPVASSWTHMVFLAAWMTSFIVFNGKMVEKRPGDFGVWWRGAFLGATFCLGISLSMHAGPKWDTFGWYVVAMSLFHYLEYLVTALTNPDNLSVDSYLINHSLAYHVAAAASWIEFAVEAEYLCPSLKLCRSVSLLGVALCVGGDALRKGAMFNAGASFNHIVQNTRRQDHALVTGGLYSLTRHPSYVGFFYWSIGTQVMLCNPVCLVVYAVTSWSFFNERIVAEEYMLQQFFGLDYVHYQRKVPTGLPWITGRVLPSTANDDGHIARPKVTKSQ